MTEQEKQKWESMSIHEKLRNLNERVAEVEQWIAQVDKASDKVCQSIDNYIIPDSNA